MKRFVLPILAVAIMTGSAVAQPEGWDIAGTYVGSGEGEITATFERQDGDMFDVTLETISGSCSGSIAGEMAFTLDGGTLQVANENHVEGSDGEQFCEVNMTFDEEGFLNLEESSGCVNFHGAACSFDGQVVSLKAAG